MIDENEIIVDGDDSEMHSSEDAIEDITEALPMDDSPSDMHPSSLTVMPVKYAPVIPPVKGAYTLFCVILKWLDNPGENVNSASNATHQAAAIYKELSGGDLIFNVVVKQIHVSFNHNAKNLNAAEKQAKAAIGNPQGPHVYAIFNNHVQNFSHGAGDTAHLLGTLTRDVCHEVGHCHPTGLGHSGKYNANGKLLPYDDGTSFMGRFASNKLTGAQLYLLGWLPENKVAQYDIGSGVADFNIENLFVSNAGDNLKVVLIPRTTGRPIYLSMPQINGKPLLAIHLSAGRGTQRVAVFANKATYAGLSFVKIADGQGFVTVRINAA